jgi:hypothetical protein
MVLYYLSKYQIPNLKSIYTCSSDSKLRRQQGNLLQNVSLLLKLGFIPFGVAPDSIWYEIKVVEDLLFFELIVNYMKTQKC